MVSAVQHEVGASGSICHRDISAAHSTVKVQTEVRHALGQCTVLSLQTHRHETCRKLFLSSCPLQTYFSLRGKACQSLRKPFASINLAGMQYTGSKSTSPGYPRIDRPWPQISMPPRYRRQPTHLQLRISYGRRRPYPLVDQQFPLRQGP